MSKASTPEHILIVGAGIFGASTAYHLIHHPPSSPPPKVTLVDRSPPSHGIGASEDINKIIRADYSQKFYMDLGYEAIEKWKEYGEEGGMWEGLYHRTGWIMMDEKGSVLSDRIRSLYRERGGDPTKNMELDEVKRAWNGILKDADVSAFGSAYFNPDAGWANAGTAVTRMIEEAQKKGLDYVMGDVTELVMNNNEKGVWGVKLANGKILEATKTVLATGAWTSRLMMNTEEDLEMEQEHRVEEQQTAAGVCVAHYKLTLEEAEKYKDMPVIVYGENGEVLPPPENGILKFTLSRSFVNRYPLPPYNNQSIPPDTSQSVVPQTLKDELLSIIESVMPQFLSNDRKADYWRLCWDSITPTQKQLICRHPDRRLKNLYLAVGGSFHSYKFLPIIGKYVANVVVGISNGEEKDDVWKWKTVGVDKGVRGAHAKVVPTRDLKDLREH